MQPALEFLHALTIHPNKGTENQTISTPNDISNLDLPIALRKEKRQCTQHPLSNFVSFDNLSFSYQALVSKLSFIKVPETVQEALRDENWMKAILEEMSALKKNNTWELVNLPKGKRKVGCKCAFTTKHRADRTLERYKARLQFDVKNAFLHGDLEEEIYMELPPRFMEDSMRNKVCRLNKALYGLKQSLRAWFGRFAKVMKTWVIVKAKRIKLSSLDIQRREG
ncbi:Retrovirus-related Pol polyprotein from transposon TNT 1-94 [Vitis vinifera]|uniref:Retrovirus-related Pol polyprotein from transposon TNT 1-94 n=1 Tax=Vitis vinifera TaxID=29760 RepID=A0A438D2J4_VITVI|nr:Retrovirus-related Pol polyprotein from transposon TNT 1-94 [Vitis vinifera]